ncbi:hypothetical protein [Martelella sp. HB161492]|uniref:hypothetical protein n=1 Tax=Martelella sp. HB161492 TaxID=2720726 RepID=UPI00158FB34E|nr:hypothetical protein [Martelella sp. HB161492]
MKQREGLSLTRENGRVRIKLHGFPITFHGGSYSEALMRAGVFLDKSAAETDRIMEKLDVQR